jgi:hypothetical protein
MMPNGMFAREKCEPRGMLNQERNEAISGNSVIVVVVYEDQERPALLMQTLDTTLVDFSLPD